MGAEASTAKERWFRAAAVGDTKYERLLDEYEQLDINDVDDNSEKTALGLLLKGSTSSLFECW